MFALLGLLILTGLNMDNEFAEETHELFAYALLATILGHLAGIAFHTYYHRENVALSMLHGKKEGPPAEATTSTRPILGAIILFSSLLFIGKLYANYDPTTQTVQIPLLGSTINLGENEGHEKNHGHHEEHDDDD